MLLGAGSSVLRTRVASNCLFLEEKIDVVDAEGFELFKWPMQVHEQAAEGNVDTTAQSQQTLHERKAVILCSHVFTGALLEAIDLAVADIVVVIR